MYNNRSPRKLNFGEDDSTSSDEEDDRRPELAEGRKILAAMSDEDINMLLSKLVSLCPILENKRASARARLIKWPEIECSNLDGEACRLVCEYLQGKKRRRKYRSLWEILREDQEIFRSNSKEFRNDLIHDDPNHPKRPKGAAGPLSLYTQDRYDTYLKSGKKPVTGFNYMEWYSAVVKDFHSLPEEEKHRLKKICDDRMEAYEAARKQFYERNRLVYVEPQKNKRSHTKQPAAAEGGGSISPHKKPPTPSPRRKVGGSVAPQKKAPNTSPRTKAAAAEGGRFSTQSKSQDAPRAKPLKQPQPILGGMKPTGTVGVLSNQQHEKKRRKISSSQAEERHIATETTTTRMNVDETEPKRSKKKKKYSETGDDYYETGGDNYYEPTTTVDETEPKKSKKKKKKHQSETGLDDSYYYHEETTAAVVDETEPKKTKKKKKRHSETDDYYYQGETTAAVVDETEPKKTKKKKKHHSETEAVAYYYQPETTYETEPKKSKKKKHHSETGDEYYETTTRVDETEPKKSKKKKKKHHSEAGDDY